MHDSRDFKLLQVSALISLTLMLDLFAAFFLGLLVFVFSLVTFCIKTLKWFLTVWEPGYDLANVQCILIAKSNNIAEMHINSVQFFL